MPQGATAATGATSALLSLPESSTTRVLDGPSSCSTSRSRPGLRLTRSEARNEAVPVVSQQSAQAADAIRSGHAPFMLAGGIDTYRDLYVLGTLDMEQRVKSAANLDGFIPGEGAAFLLLESRRHRGATPLAAVSVAVLWPWRTVTFTASSRIAATGLPRPSSSSRSGEPRRGRSKRCIRR